MKKYSIGTRILRSILILLSVAFGSLLLVFNISVSQYINRNAKQQLMIASAMMAEDPDAQAGPMQGEGGIHKQPRNPVGAEAQVFFWDGESASTGYDTQMQADVEIVQALDMEAAKEQPQTVDTGNGTYLVSVMDNPRMEGESIILYVDVTGILALEDTVNIMLVVILVVVGGVAVAVAFALANSVAKPIQKISGFAEKIGEGVFEPVQLEMKDKETSNLLDVMNRTVRKLKTYDSKQKTFFQNVSHELKTPLMTIRCNAEGIVYTVMEPKESAQTIMDETDRLGELIDDILYISKMDTITETEVLEECDLREMLSNCAESQRALAARRGIEIEYRFSDEPVWKKISEKSAKRAFCNLISNAIRYADKRIVLSCRMEDEKAVVSVRDDGAGIAEKDLPHIFERFYKGRGGQSGIGLAIVKSVVDKAGGSIIVDAMDGTQFTITF